MTQSGLKGNLSELAGRVRHCVRYGRSSTGRRVCRKYKTGKGAPWTVARSRAGIKKKFVERSANGRRKKRVCTRWGKSATGRKVCRKWRMGAKRRSTARKTTVRRKSNGRKTARTCSRWGTGKGGRRVCRKWSIKGNGRRRRSPLKGKKRQCVRFGVNSLGRRVCRRYAGSKARLPRPAVWPPGARIRSRRVLVTPAPAVPGIRTMAGLGRTRKRRCVKWGRGKGGRKVCRKYSR